MVVSLFEITTKYGTRALLRLLALVAAFLLLAALRSPLHLLVCALTALMGVVDRTVSVRLATPSPPPYRHRRAGTIGDTP